MPDWADFRPLRQTSVAYWQRHCLPFVLTALTSALRPRARFEKPVPVPRPNPVIALNRLIPLILAVALFMENMDSTVIATSLPAIARDIGTSPVALKLAL